MAITNVGKLSFSDVKGIYVGGSKVVHFTPDGDSKTITSISSSANISSPCPTYDDCGSRQPNSGVVLSCLDCFLGTGSLYLFKYGATASAFMAKVGGVSTTAQSDPSAPVIHRAMYLLGNGFGSYNLLQNNCEDFALYCKTGLSINNTKGVGRSGQVTSFASALMTVMSSPLKFLIPGPAGVVTVSLAVWHYMNRYNTDIGVRRDVTKVAVEHLAAKLGWKINEVEEPPSDELITL